MTRVGLLFEADELGVPVHVAAVSAQLVAEQAFVVVLAEDHQERIRAEIAADIAERDARRAAAARPEVGTGRAPAELERALHQAELGVDLHRARLHAERTRLARRPGMTIDDQRVDAVARELVGEHQAGGAGTDDQYVKIHTRA